MKFKESAEKFFDKYLIRYKWYNTFKSDYGFRTLIMAIGGAFINIVFAGFNAVTAICYKSVWYGVFGGYYFILAMLRISVLISFRLIKKKYGDGENLERAKWRLHLANGAMLVPLDIALGAAITTAVLMQKPAVTGDIMAIATATYAFTKIAMAIRNLVKARRARDPVVTTLRNIGFVDALASMFSLEVTLITTFSEAETIQSMRPLTAISGFAVCAFTIGLGSYMIIKAAKMLGLDKNSADNGVNESEQ